MAIFQERMISRRRLKFWLILLPLILGCLLAISGIWSAVGKNRFAREGRDRSAQEWRELNERQATLQQRLAALKTERGIETEIRKNFSVVKPGEKMIIVVDPEATATVTTTKSWWQKLLGSLGSS